MRFRRKIIAISVVSASMALGGLVLAQSPQKPPAPAPKAPPPSPTPTPAPTSPDHVPPTAAAPSDVDVPFRSRAQISPSEMMQQVAKYSEKMNEMLRRMVQLQEAARRDKDVIKLNCVNDKLLQLKQLMNIADQARNNLEEAVARGNEDERYHEFGRITIAQQQGQVLGADAENCVGTDLTFLGPTQVTVDEPELPDDPTVDDGGDFPVVEPLPVASPKS